MVLPLLDSVKRYNYPERMEVVGVTEIGKLLGVSRQRADQLTQERGFPKPLSSLASGRVWNKRDIERWIAKRRK